MNIIQTRPIYIYIYIKQKKKKNPKPLSLSLTLSLPLQTRAIDLLSSLPNPSKHVSWSVIAALIHHVCESLILASINTCCPWPTSISTTLYLWIADTHKLSNSRMYWGKPESRAEHAQKGRLAREQPCFILFKLWGGVGWEIVSLELVRKIRKERKEEKRLLRNFFYWLVFSFLRLVSFYVKMFWIKKKN